MPEFNIYMTIEITPGTTPERAAHAAIRLAIRCQCPVKFTLSGVQVIARPDDNFAELPKRILQAIADGRDHA